MSEYLTAEDRANIRESWGEEDIKNHAINTALGSSHMDERPKEQIQADIRAAQASIRKTLGQTPSGYDPEHPYAPRQ